MCLSETGVRIGRVLRAGLVLACVWSANAQWKHIAGTTIGLGLAGPATGAVTAVWFAAGGARLLAEASGGRIFETSDFQHWRLNVSDLPPAGDSRIAGINPPEPGARLQVASSRIYAAGANNVFASEDGGKTWLNLTGFNNQSVVGGGFTSLAISPANPQEIVAANRFGVWRSLDGGLSWHGLNDDLPNLTARKLVGRRSLALEDSRVVTVDSGQWKLVNRTDAELALQAGIAVKTGYPVSAAAQSGAILYAGAADGSKLAVSHDSGAKWTEFAVQRLSRVNRIWIDTDRPDTALAAVGPKLLRTVNGGLFWDDVTGALPSAEIHGVTADASANAVYIATDRGVFSATVPLNDAGPPGAWKSMSQDLPAAPAWDVRLSADNFLTVALDGYGVFETAAPHRTRNVRIVSGADMTDRAAAPGSVISVLGANVRQGSNGGTAYPVLAGSDRSSQLQVPFEASAGVFQIALQGAAERWTAPLTVKDAAPAIFVDEDGSPVVLDSSSGLNMDSNVAVHARSVIQVLATGLGKVTPDWPTGVPAPLDSPPFVRGKITAWLDGTAVEVTRATLAPGYIGYYLVELQMPAIVNRGTSELRLVMNGEESNRVKLYLEPEN